MINSQFNVQAASNTKNCDLASPSLSIYNATNHNSEYCAQNASGHLSNRAAVSLSGGGGGGGARATTTK